MSLARPPSPLLAAWRPALYALLVLLCAAESGAAAGPGDTPADSANDAAHRSETGVTREVQLERLEDALDLIEANFFQDAPRDELTERALRVLLPDLDPYSLYLDPADWAERKSVLAAEFGGLGVYFEIDAAADLPRIHHLFIGSAAAKAGARRDDLLLRIDGRDLRGLAFDDVRALLMGPVGTQATLTIMRAGSPHPIDLVVTRAVVKTPSVRGVRWNPGGGCEYMLDPGRGIAYIRITNLAEDTTPAVTSAIDTITARGAKALILDLRGSAGGLMRSAVDVADLFLDRGRILTTHSRDTTRSYDATPGGCTTLPMAVLIDGDTASSSEFLAGALKDNGRAVFIGQRTWGKARIQRLLPLGEDRGGLILTTGRWERPAGNTIDRHDGPDAAGKAGIAPDPGMEIVLAPEEHEALFQRIWLLDQPLELAEGDLPEAPPDRALLRACEVLAERNR